jgi:hypothetical protein
MGQDDALLRDLAWLVRTTAQAPHPHTRDWLRTVPGRGARLRLVLRDDRHDLPRCPRVQDVVSSGRLVTWAKASAGKRDGTGGRTIGQATRTWAFSDAAGLCWRDQPPGPNSRPRLAQTPGQGQALTLWAHHVARAVSFRFKRHTACAMYTGRHGAGRGASAPDA